MGHDRRQTLAMVEGLRTHLSYNIYYASTATFNQSFRQQTVHYAYKTAHQDKNNSSNQSESDYNEQQQFPRKTLLFLPADSFQWIPVV